MQNVLTRQRLLLGERRKLPITHSLLGSEAEVAISTTFFSPQEVPGVRLSAQPTVGDGLQPACVRQQIPPRRRVTLTMLRPRQRQLKQRHGIRAGPPPPAGPACGRPQTRGCLACTRRGELAQEGDGLCVQSPAHLKADDYQPATASCPERPGASAAQRRKPPPRASGLSSDALRRPTRPDLRESCQRQLAGEAVGQHLSAARIRQRDIEVHVP